MGKWKYEINPDIVEEVKNTPRSILLGCPHTAIEDAYQTVRFKFNKNIRKIIPPKKIKIVMKESMFLPVIGEMFKKIGFIPVDRKNPRKFWENSFQQFSEQEEFMWAFAPEGTRKLVEEWPSGFLRAAEHFNIPILVAYADYKERIARIEQIISPDTFLSEGKIDPEKLPELERVLTEIFKNVTPKDPEKFNPNIKIRWGKKKN